MKPTWLRRTGTTIALTAVSALLPGIVPVSQAGISVDGSVQSSYTVAITGGSNPSLYTTCVQGDSKMLAGGSFTAINGFPAGNLGRIPGTGTPEFDPGTGTNGTVFCTAVQDDGKILIGGQFSTVNGEPRGGLARLLSNGQLESTDTFDTGSGANAAVTGLAIQPDGQIIVCGEFTAFGGQTRGRIVRLNPDGTLESSAAFNPGTGANGTISTALVQPNGKILLGGGFTAINGQARNRIARLNANGSLESTATFNTGTGANAAVLCLALMGDGRILAGGDFTSIDSRVRGRIVRLNAAGAVESSATFSTGTGFDGSVHSIALQGNSDALAGGDFTIGNGATVNRLARIRSTGTISAGADGDGPNDTVLSVMLEERGYVIIGGEFTKVSTQDHKGIARIFNFDSSQSFTMPTANSFLWARTTSVPAPAVVTYDLTTDGGVSWQRLGPGVWTASGWAITGLTLPPAGVVRVRGRVPCGWHNGSSGIIEDFFAFNDSILDWSFNPNVTVDRYPEYPSTAVIQPDGKLVIAGGFGTVSGQARNHIARLTADDSLESTATFNTGTGPSTTGQLRSLAIQPDARILVGGGFGSWNGQNRRYSVRLSTAGTLESTSSFNYTAFLGGDTVCTAVQPDGRIIFAGGRNDISGGATQTALVRVNANGTAQAAPAWNPVTMDGYVLCMVLQPDGKILIGGNFTQINGQPRRNLARLLPDGSVESTATFNTGTGPDDWVYALAVQPDGQILAAGYFTTYNNAPHRWLVRLNPNGTAESHATFDIGAGPDSSLEGLILQADGKIIITGYFKKVDRQPSVRIARLLPNGRVDSAANFNPGPGPNEYTQAVLQADGYIVLYGSFTSVNGQVRNGMARLFNDPATGSLTAPARSRVQWLRGGTAPEVMQVSIELSTNSGASWTPLGNATRIPGGWEVTGLNLPQSGQLRASGRTTDSKSEGMLQSVAPFEFVPEIAIHAGADTSAPELSDGMTVAVIFPDARMASPSPPVRTFTIANTGLAPLTISAITLPAGYSLTSPVSLPASVAVNASLTLTVQLSTASASDFGGSITITSNDPDEVAFDFPVSGRIVTPDIAVQNGSPPAPELTDGQAAAVDFGIVRQESPQARVFTVLNTGTAPLLISGVTVPSGFTALDLPPLPAVIAVSESLAFRLRIDAGALGTFSGRVGIASDDLDEPVFDFPVTGTVVSPEIAVHEGATTVDPEITDGQAASVDFGRNIQGTPATRSFTIANTGTAELLVSSITVPPGYTALNVPLLPFTVGINQSAVFRISLTTLAVGTHTGSVMIASDDLDEALFDFPITGEVFIPDPVSGVVSTTTVLNRQTGLREQMIHITNDTTATVPAYNLIIRGLPAGVEVNNASEARADGSVVVYIRQGMSPRSVQDIVIEYYSPNRAPVEMNPQLSTEVVLNPPDLSVPGGEAGLAIENITRLTGGEMLLEFTTTPGRRYEVQFSRNGQPWQASLPNIRAASNRTQWLDRGLPRTERHPSLDASRFYRVREIP